MERFFDDDLFLPTPRAKEIYESIRHLPIIDYHCHLDEKAIADNKVFRSLGELWLSGDHYKWRAMRLCGVAESYITGDRSDYEKYLAYATVFPKLVGNPLYAWTQMELAALFDIHTPLNADTAPQIWAEAEEKLKSLPVREMLHRFGVAYIATTDDPRKELTYHGTIDGIRIAPTFRPDACFREDVDRAFLENALDRFIAHGCRIADYGFDFVRADDENLVWLMKVCAKKNILLQLHFGTFRNVNSGAFAKIGADSGFDVMRTQIDCDALAALFDRVLRETGTLPHTVLYPLNDTVLRTLATLSGAFPNVRIGAAWWFNDTASGIRRQMETVSEYAVFGTQLGMLTDSRSFSSYVRFDYYRRLLAAFLAEKVDAGEYDAAAAKSIAYDVAYGNIKAELGL